MGLIEKVAYRNHARRHNPGGSDELDFPASGGTYRNPDPAYILEGARWKVAKPYTNQVGGAVVDPTVPFGGYYELNGNGKYIVLPGPMGPPKYSIWAVTLAYRSATDGAQLLLDWQTTLVDGVFTGYGYGAGPFPESLEGAETNNTTYYVADGASFHQDFYSASPADGYVTDLSPFRVTGDDGDLLSAAGSGPISADPYGAALSTYDFNGGGGGNVMWWLRAKIVGRNASNSTGYKARIYHLGIHRVENTNGKYVG